MFAMKNRSSLLRLLSGFLIVGSILALPSGCGSNPGNTPASPAVNSISISVPQGRGFAETWEAILNEWTARTGVTHKYLEFDPAASLGQPLPANLNIIPLTSAVEYAAKGQLKVIPPLAAEADALDWQGLFQGLREKACSLSGEKTLIPLSSPTFVLYYRADLLAKAGRKPPETWDDYLKLLQDLPQWAPDLNAVEPWKADWAATMYLARAASFAKHPDHTAFLFDLESGDTMFDSAGFQKAWDINREIFKLLSPAVKDLTPYDCRREILEGRSALAVSLEVPSFTRSTQADLDALTTAKRAEGIQLGFIELPGSTESFNPTLRSWEAPRESPVNHVALTGFDGLCAVVSHDLSEEAALLAWNMLQTLTLDEDALLPPGIPSPVRESDLTRPELLAGPALEPIERGEYLATVGRSLRNRQLVLEMPVIGREKFLAVLTEAVQQGLAQPDLTGSVFTSGVAKKWSEIQQQIGIEPFRDSCRISHGLKPSIPQKSPVPLK